MIWMNTNGEANYFESSFARLTNGMFSYGNGVISGSGSTKIDSVNDKIITPYIDAKTLHIPNASTSTSYCEIATSTLGIPTIIKKTSSDTNPVSMGNIVTDFQGVGGLQRKILLFSLASQTTFSNYESGTPFISGFQLPWVLGNEYEFFASVEIQPQASWTTGTGWVRFILGTWNACSSTTIWNTSTATVQYIRCVCMTVGGVNKFAFNPVDYGAAPYIINTTPNNVNIGISGPKPPGQVLSRINSFKIYQIYN